MWISPALGVRPLGPLSPFVDGSRDPVGLDLASTQAPLRSHGLHLSLRYEF